MMVFVNDVDKIDGITKDNYETFLKILAPFAPHMCEEIWHLLDNKDFIHKEKWPEFDPKKLEEEEHIVAVQINGKARGAINVKIGATSDEVLAICKEDAKIGKKIDGKEVKRVIYVPERVINIIVD